MRLKTTESSVHVWLSARETYDWAEGSWPCSTLADRRVFASFDRTGLVDLTIDGREGVDVDGYELSALVADLLRDRLPETHTLYPGVVGQHLAD